MEKHVWTYKEAAESLGGLSVRTVKRLADRGDIERVYLGSVRLPRIIPRSVHNYIENIRLSHNRGETWQPSTKEKIVPISGAPTQRQQEGSLKDLLAARKTQLSKRKHS